MVTKSLPTSTKAEEHCSFGERRGADLRAHVLQSKTVVEYGTGVICIPEILTTNPLISWALWGEREPGEPWNHRTVKVEKDL